MYGYSNIYSGAMSVGLSKRSIVAIDVAFFENKPILEIFPPQQRSSSVTGRCSVAQQAKQPLRLRLLMPPLRR